MATDNFDKTQGELIALRIKQVRKLTGKTQVDFARLIGVSRSFLSEVEATKAKPSVEMIVGVASNFPDLASPYWLLLGYGAPGPYEESGKQGSKVDWQAMLSALKIKQRLEQSGKSSPEAAEGGAKILAMLVNAYAQTYAWAVSRGEAEEDARREADGRAREIGWALHDDMDTHITMGPMMGL